MNSETLALASELAKALGETFLMVGVAGFFAIAVGLPAGFFLFLSGKGILLKGAAVHAIGNFAVNVVRSVPFVILLVVLLPLTQLILGTTIGPVAAAVPLSVAAIAFFARLAESALCEVDPGVIEAAVAFGASPADVIARVLFPEALPGLLRALTVTIISLVGYSAMAGIVGGGGIGDLAIRFGYYRYQTEVMLVTVVALIVLVQAVQAVGDRAAARADRKKK